LELKIKPALSSARNSDVLEENKTPAFCCG